MDATALILVPEKLSDESYKQLQDFISLKLEKEEERRSLKFHRNYKANNRTYLQVTCPESAYDRIESAIHERSLWKNVDLRCNLIQDESKMYFDTFVRSFNDVKIVIDRLKQQNPKINIQLWVYVKTIKYESDYKSMLIFSVPRKDLQKKITFENKSFLVTRWRERER